jgi:ELWxxDGT repeat protein
VNGTLFFTADDGINGNELWKSDGTAAGTVLAKDICPGACGSYPGRGGTANGILFFVVNDRLNGDQLWKSDGTAAGTVELSYIDRCGPQQVCVTSGIVGVNNTAFFITRDPVSNATQLWKSDGTAPGTAIVTAIGGSCSYIGSGLTNVNGTLFFNVCDDGHLVSTLWTSDGTAAGTTSLNVSFPYICFLTSIGCLFYPGYYDLINVNGTLFFGGDDGVHGPQLWKSDGTVAGTMMLTDINPVPRNGFSPGSGLFPDYLTNLNGTLFFSATDDVKSATTELWKSDGTAAGTMIVKDMCLKPPCNDLLALTNANGTLFFVADDGVNGYELWKSDGTAAGTVMLSSPRYGNLPASSYPEQFTDVAGTLFFSADDGTHGRELWRSDGTAAGTWMVKDSCPGGCSSNPGSLTNVNGTLFLTGDDGSQGLQLWKSDGTAAGTILVKHLIGGCYPTPCGLLSNLANVNGILFFDLYNAVANEYELWKSDGTTAGTMILVPNIVTTNLVNLNGTLFFSDGSLWKSDGTAAGTTIVTNISVNGPTLTNVNGTLFFSGFDAVSGDRTLWKSDGTAAGTMSVKDLCAASGCGVHPQNLANVNGTLFFTANDGLNGLELWKSDGTAVGTVQVTDICSGCNFFPPQNAPDLTNVNGTLFFVANDPTWGPTLWRSDGSTAGTVSLFNPGLGGPQAPEDLYADGNRLLFSAKYPPHGRQLWQSDGTPAGTTLATLTTINPNGDSTTSAASNLPPPNFARSGSSIFFQATDGTTGFELWKIGTAMFTATALALTAGANPSTAGAPLTFTATVAAPFSGSPPTGTVTFMDGFTTLGAGTPQGGGTWSFTTSSLPVGIHSITALFANSGVFFPSASQTLNQVVINGGASASTTALAVNGLAAPTTVYFGVVKGAFNTQGANFVVTVTGGNDGDQVALMDGNVPLGPTLTLASGQASYRTQLPAGTHVISAIYFGNGTTEAGSMSPTVIVNRSPRPVPK